MPTYSGADYTRGGIYNQANNQAYQRMLAGRDANRIQAMDRLRGRGAYGDPAAPGREMGGGYRYSEAGRKQRAAYGMGVGPSGGPFGGNPYGNITPAAAMGASSIGPSAAGGGFGGGASGGGGSVAGGFADAYEEARLANEQRYGQGLDELTNLRKTLLEGYGGFGQSMIDEANRVADQRQAADIADLTQRGLGSTTATLQSGIARGRERDRSIREIRDLITERQLGADERSTNNIVGFIERREDMYPDLGQFASIAQLYGQGGLGPGGTTPIPGAIRAASLYGGGYDPYMGLGALASPFGGQRQQQQQASPTQSLTQQLQQLQVAELQQKLQQRQQQAQVQQAHQIARQLQAKDKWTKAEAEWWEQYVKMYGPLQG